MHQKKYSYSYPENIKIGALLSVSDRKIIAETLNFSNRYINQIFTQGIRNNGEAIQMAHIIIANKEQLKLQLTKSKTSHEKEM